VPIDSAERALDRHCSSTYLRGIVIWSVGQIKCNASAIDRDNVFELTFYIVFCGNVLCKYLPSRASALSKIVGRR